MIWWALPRGHLRKKLKHYNEKEEYIHKYIKKWKNVIDNNNKKI